MRFENTSYETHKNVVLSYLDVILNMSSFPPTLTTKVDLKSKMS